MINRPLKILLLGDTSNFHNTLAVGLRSYGHDVTVASDGTQWMDTKRDINLSRRLKGKAGGALLWLDMRYGPVSRRLVGYDVVSLSGTHFVRLRPERLRSIFEMVKRCNSHLFMTALATDTFFIEECLDPNSKLAYSEWRVDGQETLYGLERNDIARSWLSDPLRGYCNYLAENAEGVVTALYEYDLSVRRAFPSEKICYGGIPIDTESIEFRPIDIKPGEKVKLFLGYPSRRMLEKGAERLLEVARQVKKDYSELCELDIVTDLPLVEFKQHLSDSHVVIDQLYSYTPATTALMAMAMGKTVMSGGEADFYSFIAEPELRPIVNVVPDNRAIYNSLVHLVTHPEELSWRGIEGRKFVEKHNDTRIVAGRYLRAWQHFTNINTKQLAE